MSGICSRDHEGPELCLPSWSLTVPFEKAAGQASIILKDRLCHHRGEGPEVRGAEASRGCSALPWSSRCV